MPPHSILTRAHRSVYRRSSDDDGGPANLCDAGQCIDNTSVDIEYSPSQNWRTITVTGASAVGTFNNDVTFSQNTGDSLTVTFNGTGVKVFGAIVPHGQDDPSVVLSIDDDASSTLEPPPGDTVSEPPVLELFSTQSLQSGSHILSITNNGFLFWLDRFEVTPAPSSSSSSTPPLPSTSATSSTSSSASGASLSTDNSSSSECHRYDIHFKRYDVRCQRYDVHSKRFDAHSRRYDVHYKYDDARIQCLGDFNVGIAHHGLDVVDSSKPTSETGMGSVPLSGALYTNGGGPNNAGIIAAGVIGGLIFLILVGLWLYRRSDSRRRARALSRFMPYTFASPSSSFGSQEVSVEKTLAYSGDAPARARFSFLRTQPTATSGGGRPPPSPAQTVSDGDWLEVRSIWRGP
ncbi:uncharacterized protein BXZ73DRAFT_100680 [Epithele typhae]|uniref:uncharacterized protein n=1 Tax=Epithele typhae TaxID=378194 RepID=UPI002007ABD6|nr:uncharacterized protein BXZ73DRAFT_100680 [Epithele typhae]KAH9934489.1 hypothetical protein BXZ73DRAFT_100680 [Epithele typhae]